MDISKVSLVVFVLIFFFFLPHKEESSSREQELGRLLNEERTVINLLNGTSYGALDAGRNRWINITGLRQEDGFAWGLLPRVQQRTQEQFQKSLHGPLFTDMYSPSRSPYRLDEIVETQGNFNVSIEENDWVRRDSLYQNVTGVVHGQWVRSKITDGLKSPVLNLTALVPDARYVTQKYNRNITSQHGDMQIELIENDSSTEKSSSELIREVRAKMIIKEEILGNDGWGMTLHGVHYLEQGQIILVTTSQKFPGIFALPQFTLSIQGFLTAQKLLNRTLSAVLAKQKTTLYSPYFISWSSSPLDPAELLFPSPHCEYIVYLQQYPTILSNTELKAIEEELRFPSGAPVSVAPAMKMSALIFSPDCGFILESRGPPEHEGLHLVGSKLESFLLYARCKIFALVLLIGGEMLLLLRQLKDITTPSTRSRVCFYTVAMMAFGDGFVFLGLIVASIFLEAVFLPLISAAFLSFLCVGIFGMKFLMDVWTAQAPERLERDRRAATNALSVITAAGANTLPLHVTARRIAEDGSTNVILPPDQDFGAADVETVTQSFVGSTQSEMATVYSRFCFFLLTMSFLSLHATSWPKNLRSVYTKTLTFGYLSFWVPQIYRNLIRNCRKALRWEYVIGQSLLRLAPFVYFYFVKDNILFVEADQIAACLLVGWVWIQNWVLIAQEILGPRFFVLNRWLLPAYDYHPILREDEEGGSMPIGFTHATTKTMPSTVSNETTGRGNQLFDCAICMQSLEVPIVRAGSVQGDGKASSATHIFSKRAYMVTPCRHIFHSHCLESWMKYRLQCPICRDSLPPL